MQKGLLGAQRQNYDRSREKSNRLKNYTNNQRLLVRHGFSYFSHYRHTAANSASFISRTIIRPTCEPAMQEADNVFGSICLSVCTKSQKLLNRNWCSLVVICTMVNARSDWKLPTFNLDLWPWELFSYFFSNSSNNFWMPWASSFLVDVEIHLQNI